MANFEIIHEVTNGEEGHWRLCFQYGTYHYDLPDPSQGLKATEEEEEYGYRFIWRKSNGNLQPARAQARIPSTKDIFELLALASKDGWLNK